MVIFDGGIGIACVRATSLDVLACPPVREEGASRHAYQSGNNNAPAERFDDRPAGARCLASSTSAPGRGRALGRAAGSGPVATSELRPARLFQADVATGPEPATSEPETAGPLTNRKQGAGAAQRRPGCSASS